MSALLVLTLGREATQSQSLFKHCHLPLRRAEQWSIFISTPVTLFSSISQHSNDFSRGQRKNTQRTINLNQRIASTPAHTHNHHALHRRRRRDPRLYHLHRQRVRLRRPTMLRHQRHRQQRRDHLSIIRDVSRVGFCDLPICLLASWEFR